MGLEGKRRSRCEQQSRFVGQLVMEARLRYHLTLYGGTKGIVAQAQGTSHNSAYVSPQVGLGRSSSEDPPLPKHPLQA